VRLKSASLLRSACPVVLIFAAAGESIQTGIFNRLPAGSITDCRTTAAGGKCPTGKLGNDKTLRSLPSEASKWATIQAKLTNPLAAGGWRLDWLATEHVFQTYCGLKHSGFVATLGSQLQT
jgi:hypothetical protein